MTQHGLLMLSQKRTFRIQICPFIMWILEVHLGSTGVAARSLYKVIHLIHLNFFNINFLSRNSDTANIVEVSFEISIQVYVSSVNMETSTSFQLPKLYYFVWVFIIVGSRHWLHSVSSDNAQSRECIYISL